MKLDIAKAKVREDEAIKFEGEMEIDMDMLGGDEPLGKVKYIGEYLYLQGCVFLKGEAKLLVKSVCDRCLKSLTYEVTTDINEKFVSKQDLELNDCEECYSYEDDVLDIENYIRDRIILSVPSQKLCKSNCKGLCSGCGVDLNEEKCKCKKDAKTAKESSSNPFDILKNLK